MSKSGRMIRVLVVDDSALMRKLIPQLIESDSELHVVATAMDGAFALKKIDEYKPDVITLDLEMPRMDGIETLRQIMRVHPIPVVVVSAHTVRAQPPPSRRCTWEPSTSLPSRATCSPKACRDRRRPDPEDQGRGRESASPPDDACGRGDFRFAQS